MSPELSSLRTELITPAIFQGKVFDQPKEWIIRRGGRILPSTEFSSAELEELSAVTRRLSATAIESAQSFVIPSQKQLDRITFDTEIGCWTLPTYQDPKRSRYGRMAIKGVEETSSLAHRMMYRVFFGPDSLPNGPADFLDHICENKACCYPRHTERVTVKENTRRGRVKIGHDHPTLEF